MNADNSEYEMTPRTATVVRVARRMVVVLWALCAVGVVLDFFSPGQPLNVRLGAARSGGELFAGFFLIFVGLVGQGIGEVVRLYSRIFVLALLFCWLALRAFHQARALHHDQNQQS
jgi:hypothetical protein